MPNIELETFDYTGRNMKKKSPSVTREEEVKVPVDQGSSKKEESEGEVEGLCLRFARMRSTQQCSLIQVKTRAKNECIMSYKRHEKSKIYITDNQWPQIYDADKVF